MRTVDFVKIVHEKESFGIRTLGGAIITATGTHCLYETFYTEKKQVCLSLESVIKNLSVGADSML